MDTELLTSWSSARRLKVLPLERQVGGKSFSKNDVFSFGEGLPISYRWFGESYQTGASVSEGRR